MKLTSDPISVKLVPSKLYFQIYAFGAVDVRLNVALRVVKEKLYPEFAFNTNWKYSLFVTAFAFVAPIPNSHVVDENPRTKLTAVIPLPLESEGTLEFKFELVVVAL